MSLLRTDSFNHYDTVSDKWDFAFNGSIITDASIARTGTRCLQVFGGSSGPFFNLGIAQGFGEFTQLIQGVAMNFDGFTGNSDIMHFNLVGPATQVQNIKVVLNSDFTISVYRGAGDTIQALLGTSAPVFVLTTPGSNVWNYIEAKVLFSATVGTVEVRFAPPGGPMSTILTIGPVKTVAVAAAPITNQVGILATAGITHACYFADYYISDWSDGSDFLGGVRVYHDMPFENGPTVQFTPLANTNWEEVDEIPPDGDTGYNGGDTAGLLDQYNHNLGTVPPGSQIMAVQHVMDMRVDAGSRAVTSVVQGVAFATSVYLSGNYSMYCFPYDLNPGSGLPWAELDFPVPFGPEVTV